MDLEVFLNKNNSHGNVSMESFSRNVTFGVPAASGMVKERNMVVQIFLILFLTVGILGNLLALIRLARKRTYSSGSYALMLRCLITNNLIGLMGVATMIILKRCLSKVILQEYAQELCACWVVFRFFGISSGCIAVIMSIDRYMILYYHFYYQEHFTRKFIRNAIIGLSSVAAVITFLPFVGFGLYVDKDTKECLRYRDAETLQDKAYAILFFIFGTLICIVIVTCNTFVIRFIVHKSDRKNSDCSLSSSETNLTTASSVEIKFSKLMTFLSLSFVVCWMPQMISVIFALITNMPPKHWFYNLADALIALHFTLDPYVYVLSGKKLPFFVNRIKCWVCCLRRSPSNQNRIGINNGIVDCSL